MGNAESEFGDEKRGLGVESESEGCDEDDFEALERTRSGGSNTSAPRQQSLQGSGVELKGER